MVAGPIGMPFQIVQGVQGNGIPVPLSFHEGGTTSNAETPPNSDWLLVITGCPASASAAAVAAAILAARVSIPLPFGSTHFKVAYSALSGPITATPW